MPLPTLPELKVQLSVVDQPLGSDPTNYYGIPSFGGWNDITSDVRSVSIDRGRSNDLEKVGTGTASIVLSNKSRQYDPLSTTSPYYDALTSYNYLRPRNQIRVFGVYPNDPTVNGYCYNMQDQTTWTPTSGGFDIDGYTNGSTVAGGVNVALTSGLTRSSYSTISVVVYVKPTLGVLWSDPTATFQLCELQTNGFYAYVSGGFIVVARNYSPSATILDAPIPSAVLNTDKGMWLKITVGATAAVGSIQWCPEQFQPPTNWTDITRNKTSSISMSGSNTNVQIMPASLYGDPSYWPVYVKRLQVYATTGGTAIQFLDLLPDTHISLFQGYVSGWPQEYEMMGKDPVVKLSCFDNSGLLGNMKVPTDLLETIIPPTSPWGWWKMGDAADVCVDYSGNSHDLTYTPSLTFQHSTDVRVASGLSGVASVFAPSTTTPSYIVSGHVAPTVSSQDCSFSFWMLTDQQLYSPDTARVFTMDNGSTTINLRASVFGSVTVENRQMSRVAVGLSATDSVSTPVGTYVTDGLPHHVCMTYKASTGAMKLYLDGKVVTSSTVTTNLTHGGVISMGRSSPNVSEINVIAYRGALQDVVYWNNLELSATQVLNIFNAGYGYVDESSGSRMTRILDYAGFPERLRNIDPSTYATCGAVEYTEDQAILELMQKVEDTEVGILFTNRLGQLTLRGRYYLSMADTGINVQASFDDTGTNIGYQGLRFSYDAEQLVNDHIVVDDVGAEYQSDEPYSVSDYGRRSRTVNTLLNDTVSARNMAIGLTNIYSEPILKAEPFEIKPLGTNWLKTLPLDIGDRINLKATPMGIPPQINQDLALQSISYDIRPKDWNTTIIGSPRPVISYFVLDRSSLDGPDVLGF